MLLTASPIRARMAFSACSAAAIEFAGITRVPCHTAIDVRAPAGRQFERAPRLRQVDVEALLVDSIGRIERQLDRHVGGGDDDRDAVGGDYLRVKARVPALT